MEVQEPRGRSRAGALAAVSIVALVLAAGLVVYASTYSGSGGTGYSSTISNLQNQISSLQLNNNALQAELSSLKSQGNASGGYSAAQLYARYRASVVTVQGVEVTTVDTFFGPVTSVSEVLGSGFAVLYNGSSYIVTNFHVVDGVSNISATFSDGNAYRATVVGTDKYSDIAVLSISAPTSEYVYLTLAGLTNAPVVGEPVYAIGNPFGLSGSMTFGIVSQTGRTITESTSTSISIPDIIQFSAPINPGNSGGPLLNSDGLVIGITTATVSNSQGLGFAIPASTIVRELPSLISRGSYSQHPYLGIAGADMDLQLALAQKANATYGVLVQAVSAGSPAAAAGIKAGTAMATVEGSQYVIGGDIIVSVNGVKVLNQDGLSAYLEENAAAGQTIQLGILRSGSLVAVSVTLGSLP